MEPKKFFFTISLALSFGRVAANDPCPFNSQCECFEASFAFVGVGAFCRTSSPRGYRPAWPPVAGDRPSRLAARPAWPPPACSGWPPVPPDRPSLLAACPPWPPSVFVISLEGSLFQMAAQCKRMIVNITIFELPPFVTTSEGVHLMAAQVKLQMNFKCINLVLLKWTKI